MKSLVAMAFFAYSISALASETVRPSLELSAVRVEVTWVADRLKLAEIRKQYETPAERGRNGNIVEGNDGFSVLGRRDGEYVCLIFAYRPRTVNDDRTTALGHELLHCLLGDYHR